MRLETRWILAVVLILLAVVASATAQTSDDPATQPDAATTQADAEGEPKHEDDGHGAGGWYHAGPFEYEEGLLGDAWGLRPKLSEFGVDVHFHTLITGQSIVDGGTESKDVLSASYDLSLYFDTAAMGLWENGHGLFRLEGKTNDSGVNPYTGAIIPVNFDAVVPEPGRNAGVPTEWWYSHRFADGKIELVAGMYDIARFFDLSPFSGPYHYRFMNAHMFFNSVLLPYAPYNKLGGVLIVKPNDWLTVTTGISDPNSSAVDVDWFDESDFNLLHEWRMKLEVFPLPTMLNIGFAYTDQDRATIAQNPMVPGTEMSSDDWAGFLGVTQWLYQDEGDPHRAIALFGRFGFTDGDVNIIENHLSGGVSFDGMIPSRPKDVIGVAAWYNDFSGDLSPTLDDSSYGFEAYYKLQLTNWVALTGDIQYLLDPGIQQGADDTVVLGLRAMIQY
ncbi:MAG: carbohydrate porin [Planctomycetota bacterium]|jgi:porin